MYTDEIKFHARWMDESSSTQLENFITVTGAKSVPGNLPLLNTYLHLQLN